MVLLALAFEHNAFKDSRVKKPGELFSLTVLQGAPCHPMDAGMYGNTGLSPLDEWRYMQLHAMGTDFNLKRPGFLAGSPQELSSYALPNQCRRLHSYPS